MFRPDRLREHAAGPNALTAARDGILARGGRVVDLVSGRLDAHGLRFPDDLLRDAIEESRERASVYAPDPMGRADAREAIAAHCAETGLVVPPARVLVTPGTSVSYLWAFAVLAEPGDEVLVPRPSYPLFDEIARVANVRLVPYALREENGWRIDLEQLETRVSTRTRAVVLVSPHNPTGAVASAEEAARLGAIARRHDLAILVDEVFADLVLDAVPPARVGAGADAPLVLMLNGFSKLFALPGWKIGWIAITGDEDRAEKAAWMLAHVSDAFLPVNEAAQAAVPGIFARGAAFRVRLREHARRGRDLVLAALGAAGAAIVPPAGGLFLVARLPEGAPPEEELALDLLREDGVLVHPGFFHDIRPDHLVLSYAADEPTLRPALAAIARRIAAR